MAVCQRCNGSGIILKDKCMAVKGASGTVYTETVIVQETCPSCTNGKVPD